MFILVERQTVKMKHSKTWSQHLKRQRNNKVTMAIKSKEIPQ